MRAGPRRAHTSEGADQKTNHARWEMRRRVGILVLRKTEAKAPGGEIVLVVLIAAGVIGGAAARSAAVT
jgi:hypothetical protein